MQRCRLYGSLDAAVTRRSAGRSTVPDRRVVGLVATVIASPFAAPLCVPLRSRQPRDELLKDLDNLLKSAAATGSPPSDRTGYLVGGGHGWLSS